jgi:hypothetical protein
MRILEVLIADDEMYDPAVKYDPMFAYDPISMLDATDTFELVVIDAPTTKFFATPRSPFNDAEK